MSNFYDQEWRVQEAVDSPTSTPVSVDICGGPCLMLLKSQPPSFDGLIRGASGRWRECPRLPLLQAGKAADVNATAELTSHSESTTNPMQPH